MTHQRPFDQAPPSFGAPAQPTAAPAAGRDRRRDLLAGGAAGFVLAGVIALVLGLAGALPSDGSSDSVSSDSVSLPARLGSYGQIQDVVKQAGGTASANQSLVTSTSTSNAKTAAALSAANSGAGAAVQTYADSSLQKLFAVWVVRAHTAAPVVAYQDPKDLGLAEAPDRVEQFGSTACQVHSIPTAAGKSVPANADSVVMCQRSSGALTVQIRPSYPDSDVQQTAALVDQAWSAVH